MIARDTTTTSTFVDAVMIMTAKNFDIENQRMGVSTPRNILDAYLANPDRNNITGAMKNPEIVIDELRREPKKAPNRAVYFLQIHLSLETAYRTLHL